MDSLRVIHSRKSSIILLEDRQVPPKASVMIKLTVAAKMLESTRLQEFKGL